MGVKLNVEPRSPEWFNLRTRSIGASDYAAIKTGSKNSILTSKMNIHKGQVPENNVFAKRGQELEPLINKKVMEILGKNLNFEEGVYVSEQHPQIIASLDGYDKDKSIALEIKTTKYLMSSKEYYKLLQKWSHQLLQQYFVMGASIKLYLAVYITSNADAHNDYGSYLVIYSIDMLEEMVIYNPILSLPMVSNYAGSEAQPYTVQVASYATWMNECLAFLNELNISINQLEAGWKDDKSAEVLTEYSQLDEEAKRIKKRMEEIKKIIEVTMLQNASTCEANGYKLTKYCSKTITNYEQYIKDFDIIVPTEFYVPDYKKYIESGNIKIPDQYISRTESVKITKLKT